MQLIAFYDMDKTITRRASFGPFLAHAVPRLAPWRLILLPAVVCVVLAYGANIIDRARLKEINLGLLLGRRINREKLANVAQSFAEKTRSTNVLSGALHRIRADQDAGYQVIIASASYEFYVVEIAKSLQIADVIATRAMLTGDDLRPEIDGENCYSVAKLDRVQAWLADHGIARSSAHIRFYSDHVSDAPCLDWSDEGFAVCPHPPLRELARRRGWPIFDWV
jgi:HAD superfamily hydrolase (TIGR01490 family)